MTDEIALRKHMERAAQAEAVLGNPLILEAFGAVEEDILTRWKSSEARDTHAREMAWMTFVGLGLVRQYLETMVADGKVAGAEVEKIEAADPLGR